MSYIPAEKSFEASGTAAMAMVTVHTGNGAYCYANSLHMTFLASGADAASLPDAGRLECLRVHDPAGTPHALLPLSVDASRFAELAGRPEAADALECQARLWGGALSWSSR